MSIAALRRKLTGEIMDSPTLDQGEHLLALDGLRNINRVSHAADAIFHPLLNFAQRRQLTSLRVLDVACGGGDVPVDVAAKAKSAGITIHLTLLDRSELAVNHAADAAANSEIECATRIGDAVVGQGFGAQEKPFDIITNSLFLHHLSEEEVIAVLGHMRKAASGAVIISDLRRSLLGWIIAWVGCRILSRSPIVHYDGPVSVRAAWTPEELKAMALRAGMTGVTITPAFPWRMILVWEGDAHAA
jgi:2-polyprenyl-3-methyl-5-hydroxy-6-metoxy-1,4-benzoquinol methylase